MSPAPRKKAATSGSIRSYFAPVQRSTQGPNSSQASSSALSSFSVTPTPPEPSLPSQSSRRTAPHDEDEVFAAVSSPVRAGVVPIPTTPLTARKPVSRDITIAASDDDDESDASFEALEDLLARRVNPITPTKNRLASGVVSTPQRPRGDSIFSSPLTNQPREPQFKMADLLDAAKKDSNIEASLSRLHQRGRDANAKKTEPRLAGDSLRRTLEATVGDEHDYRLDKVVRAVERTESVSTRNGWFFFNKTASTRLTNREPFPSRTVSTLLGKRSICKNAKDLDLTKLNKALRISGSALPDDLFLWLLDELCTEKSGIRRDEMWELMKYFKSDAISLRLTPKYLEGLFLRLGASQSIKLLEGTDQLPAVPVPAEGFYDRDWSCLCSIMDVILAVSEQLSAESIIYLAKLLLAMAVDSELLSSPEVLVAHRDVLSKLLSTLASEDTDRVFHELISTMYHSFTSPSMRLRSLQYLPSTTMVMHGLRRRMAAVYFFDDVALAKCSALSPFTLSEVQKRLQSSQFKIRSNTDYVELRALILLLDMTIDSGFESDVTDPLQHDITRNSFDVEIDKIVDLLKELARSINDAGMKSIFPMEAKLAMEWVRERLTYTVRSKPVPKISIYDIPGQPMPDPSLPKQQNYMKHFLQGRLTGAQNL